MKYIMEGDLQMAMIYVVCEFEGEKARQNFQCRGLSSMIEKGGIDL